MVVVVDCVVGACVVDSDGVVEASVDCDGVVEDSVVCVGVVEDCVVTEGVGVVEHGGQTYNSTLIATGGSPIDSSLAGTIRMALALIFNLLTLIPLPSVLPSNM